jgi:FkbM family methyltransferase
MKPQVVKGIRTLQSYFPALQSTKESIQSAVRAFLRIPHEKDFRILQHIDFNGRIFIDVGANRGQSINSAKAMRPDIQIVSFEPQPGLARRLERIYKNDPLVQIRDVGLSDTEGSFKIFTPVYRGYVYHGLSSLDKNSASHWLSTQAVFYFDPKRLSVKEEDCKVRQLDQENLAPAIIKIDVQGTEGRVLRGAAKTIERYKPVIIVERDTGMNDVRKILAGFEYREYRIEGDNVTEGEQIGDNAIMMTPDTYRTLNSKRKKQ